MVNTDTQDQTEVQNAKKLLIQLEIYSENQLELMIRKIKKDSGYSTEKKRALIKEIRTKMGNPPISMRPGAINKLLAELTGYKASFISLICRTSGSLYKTNKYYEESN